MTEVVIKNCVKEDTSTNKNCVKDDRSGNKNCVKEEEVVRKTL